MINVLAVIKNQKLESQMYAALSDGSRYHLAVVDSGFTALEAIGQKRFHLIVIARDLTYMNGMKTAEKIRNIMGVEEPPPFAIAAPRFTREEIEDFLTVGVFDFWESPLSLQRIRLTVDMAAKWRSRNDNLLSYGEYLERNR